MKIALLASVVVHFLSSSPSSALNDASPAIPNTYFLDGEEVAYPVAVADDIDVASDLPAYCSDTLDYTCYRKGAPRCCFRSNRNCPSQKPQCNRRRKSSQSRIISRGGVCQQGSTVYPCEAGYACLGGVCVIPAGVACSSGDICANGYPCSGGMCSVPRPAQSRIIGRGGACQQGDICEAGYNCLAGMCVIPSGGTCGPGAVCANGYPCLGGICQAAAQPRNVPTGGACGPGATCANGSFCNNGLCSTGKWYTNWSYCIMDCPVSAGSCCGGYANSWDQIYSSMDSCCGQSAFQGNADGCRAKSQHCGRKD